ncbi:ankyrin repeat domain-containing protein [Desertimonas flava]|uniref:ankyrin repeat domain-containing protein n=1 Tax=Desertimonas flava TaxID=2064846 RepID=UPI000E34BCD1|nr:ankyrin repeat domain-containing protein [Desertimonas flava]
MRVLHPDDATAVAATEAIRRGDVERLRELLNDDGDLATAGVGTRGPGGQIRTLLHIATDWPGNFPGVADTIGVLVDAGADVDAAFVGPHAERPLHWAASTDDVAAVDALLDAGADIEAPGSVIDGSTALMDAVAFGQWRAARRLVERGASVTPWQAAALGLAGPVDAFLAADPAPTPDDLGSVLWAACHGGQTDIARQLVTAGGAVDWVAPWDGTTPHDAARRSGASDVVAWLAADPITD